MPELPLAVAFDIFETVFDLKSLTAPLVKLGLKPDALQLWYGRTLRDGFAIALAGAFTPYQQVARAALTGLLADHGLPSTHIDDVINAMTRLEAHPDAIPAFDLLQSHGIPILALSNGSQESTRALLDQAGLTSRVAQVVSIDDIKCWKPRREIYLHAARIAQVAPERLALVAAHAWDVQGAQRAGLRGGWVARQETMYSAAMPPPDASGSTLVEVCHALLGEAGALSENSRK